MYRIAKTFTFEAAHRLSGLPEEHKCARTHGHSYRVEIVLESEQLTETGFVDDFAELKPLGDYIAASLDHSDLNSALDGNPTSELLARHLADWFERHLAPDLNGQLASVRVSETASSWAEYLPASCRESAS
ncbi:MAG TPA: 6-carboxytetrahydropterin synthase [Actinocrinis sp.]|uniref:6-pyruvoyl trahydropterin synthase family protein n=1 Tax=Actinocrinis sp. TaxID=1920516 RepID=UPI002DDC92A5|nr:6-carboxytetrahydropterin synthase [Actinocrinis sp.]HEV2347898.1 6-carboxytetrahydropterin synthase [Actinocrinis sp.]